MFYETGEQKWAFLFHSTFLSYSLFWRWHFKTRIFQYSTMCVILDSEQFVYLAWNAQMKRNIFVLRHVVSDLPFNKLDNIEQCPEFDQDWNSRLPWDFRLHDID
jgi:hypothetical protein